MNKEHLAIASVPCQEWGNLYPEKQALKVGTIFEDLNMPFFAADGTMNGGENQEKKNSLGVGKPGAALDEERESYMQKIYEVSFFLDDLILYLDTHPKDKEALKLYVENSKKRAEMKKQFAEKFYPLTRDCMAECGRAEDVFCWQEGPCPWEGACV